MIDRLPHDREEAHEALMEKINEHTEEIKQVKDENRRQNAKLDCIDQKVNRIDKNTAGLIEIFRAGGGTVKTAKWFGKLLVWIGSISSAVYAIWYAIVNWPHKGG